MTGRLVNPRDSLTQDVAELIALLHSKAHVVIICGDINEDMNERDTNTWCMMLASNNMQVCTDVKFGTASLPNTFDKGHKCLDTIACSDTLNPTAILAVGYLPFRIPFASDHRMIFVDLDAERLFGDHIPDITRSSFRHFNTNNIKQTEFYLTELRRHFSNNKIFEKVKRLQTSLHNNTDAISINHVVAECKSLEKKITQLMLAAERAITRGHYTVSYWWSRKLTKAANTYLELKKERRRLSLCNATVEEMDHIATKLKIALNLEF